jgi:hypothetical protein
VAAPLYLLDTNILVHYVRASAIWERVEEMKHYEEPKPKLRSSQVLGAEKQPKGVPLSNRPRL